MTDLRELVAEIEREYSRLGLNQRDSPYGLAAGDEEGIVEYLAMLRALAPGVTWRDLHPEMPAHWVLGEPDSWTEPFKPYGPWDYQQLPAGAAVMVGYLDVGAGAKFNALVERAKAAGFAMYGAGIKYLRESNDESNWGAIVLPLGATQDEIYALVDWANAQPDVHHARSDRSEDKVYYEG